MYKSSVFCLYPLSLFLFFAAINSSLRIDNPELFAQFERGQIGEGVARVHVRASAHPHILSQPRRFENASSPIIEFVDTDSILSQSPQINTIHIYPHSRCAAGQFYNGFDLLGGMPDNYVGYKLAYAKHSFVSRDDVNAILSWKAAQALDISDDSGVIGQLYRRRDEFAALENLQVLKLNVHPADLPAIALNAFFDIFPQLYRVDFRFVQFQEAEDIQAFVSAQQIPEQFKRIVSVHEGTVSFLRKN